jgi:Lrp/AsnC family leucine-responsive transcriptional regulator
MFPLDDIDVRLIHELQRDGKASLTHLGELVGMSAPSVMERVRKLEQAGVIRGYAALVDARAVGLDVTAFVGVSVAHPRHIETFERQIMPMAEVLECHHITGFHTLLLKVKVANTAALEKLITAIRALDGVERTETMVVLSTRAERVAVALPSPAAAPEPRVRRLRRVENG